MPVVERCLALLSLRGRYISSDAMQWPAAVALAIGVSVATGALLWFGYIATREWRRGTDLLIERRQTEALVLVSAALNRDMKGAWTTVILPLNQMTIEEDPPYNLLQVAAKAFARFPYPESLIIWKDNGHPNGSTYVFNRADRLPSWEHRSPSNDPFPVLRVRDPQPLDDLIAALRGQAESARAFAVLEVTIAGVPYQVVAHLMFASPKPHNLTGVAAFTVNLEWVRHEYFAPLLAQVARIGGQDDALSLTVKDDRGAVVASNGSAAAANARGLARPFPMLFLDSALVSSLGSRRPAIREWTVHVLPSRDNALLAASQGARRMFLLLALAAVVSTLALLLTLRSVQASVVVASMKSEFVSAVTHELKTPLALIRLVGDTLVGGRYTSTATVQDYARLLSQESLRLSQCIDNLLTYARYSDPRQRTPIKLAPTDICDVVEDALERFQPTLVQRGFQVSVDVARELPRVLTDRSAIVQVIENVIDNAIKYSADKHVLRIVGCVCGKYVQVTFSDQGSGIAKEDLGRVCDRFYRGRNAKQGGSGLGLAIAQRILRYHGGMLAIRSAVDVGTEVDVLLVAIHES